MPPFVPAKVSDIEFYYISARYKSIAVFFPTGIPFALQIVRPNGLL